MKKIIAFAGSSSSKSINLQLAIFTSKLMKDVSVEILNLNDYELPLFSVDLEEKIDEPLPAKNFLEKLKSADGIILSLAEHNGAYSAVFKNLLDWISRIDPKPFANKPMLLMATSPGARGGMSVLEIAKSKFPFMGANIKSTFSLPHFDKNFELGKGITNLDYLDKLKLAIESLFVTI